MKSHIRNAVVTIKENAMLFRTLCVISILSLSIGCTAKTDNGNKKPTLSLGDLEFQFVASTAIPWYSDKLETHIVRCEDGDRLSPSEAFNYSQRQEISSNHHESRRGRMLLVGRLKGNLHADDIFEIVGLKLGGGELIYEVGYYMHGELTGNSLPDKGQSYMRDKGLSDPGMVYFKLVLDKIEVYINSLQTYDYITRIKIHFLQWAAPDMKWALPTSTLEDVAVSVTISEDLLARPLSPAVQD